MVVSGLMGKNILRLIKLLKQYQFPIQMLGFFGKLNALKIRNGFSWIIFAKNHWI